MGEAKDNPETEENEVIQNEAEELPIATDNKPEEKRSNKGLFIAVGAIILVIILLIGAAFVFGLIKLPGPTPPVPPVNGTNGTNGTTPPPPPPPEEMPPKLPDEI